MVAPAIAIGIYEALAAAVAATGVGATAIARRREVAEGLDHAAGAAQEVIQSATLWAAPHVIGVLTGTRFWRLRPVFGNTDAVPVETLPLPEFADTVVLEKIGVPRLPMIPVSASVTAGDTPVLPSVRGLPQAGTAQPSGGGPPEDPLNVWRRMLKDAREIAGKIGTQTTRIAQNPWVRGAATFYQWYVYGSTALSTLIIGVRMLAGSEKNGPVLYDYFYKPLFGESPAARAFLGSHQVMSSETTSGMMAMTLARHLVGGRFAGRLGQEFVDKFLGQLFGFWSAHAYSVVGNLTFFEDQMAANAISAHNVDINRASRTATFYGLTSILYFPLVGLLTNVPRIRIGKWVLDGIGRTGFKDWLGRSVGPDKVTALRPTLLDYGNRALVTLWQGVQDLLGPRLSATVAPHYIPRFQTWLLYAVFATAYRNATQAVASLPFLEDSDWSESMKMTNARNAISVVLTDPYFYLCAKVNSFRAVFGNQLVFIGLIYGLNQFFSRFDGKDIAINEANRMLQRAANVGPEAVMEVVLSKPLVQRRVIVPPYVNLSPGTWARLSDIYAQDPHLGADFVSQLSGAMTALFHSEALDNRRVGMALGVMLTQISAHHKGIPGPQRAWRDALRRSLEQDGVLIHPRHAGRPLEAPELDRVFEDINEGIYDEAPLFQFPRS